MANKKKNQEEELEKDLAKEPAEEEAAEQPAETEADTEETSEETPEAETDKRDLKIKELEEKSLRQMAEFENFRKRTEKEKSEMFGRGAVSVIEKILPVIDNFERGLATLTEEQKAEPFAAGMDKVYQQLITELSGIGVEPIECVGKEMDPNLFNAVMQVETDEYESGVVAQELLKGYKYHDTVVRHSMVGVAQ